MEFSVATTLSGVLAISTPACTGPLACALRSSARPSQNCASLNTALSTVGELRGPFCQPWPIEVGMLSSPPVARLWQELHENTPEADMRGSKKSALPRSIFSGVTGLSVMAGMVEGTAANISSARSRSSEACAAAPSARQEAVPRATVQAWVIEVSLRCRNSRVRINLESRSTQRPDPYQFQNVWG